MTGVQTCALPIYNVAQMASDPKAPLVELDEVVHAVLFLASDDASAITGQIVPITGKAY